MLLEICILALWRGDSTYPTDLCLSFSVFSPCLSVKPLVTDSFKKISADQRGSALVFCPGFEYKFTTVT